MNVESRVGTFWVIPSHEYLSRFENEEDGFEILFMYLRSLTFLEIDFSIIMLSW